jgi:hypothetical protein
MTDDYFECLRERNEVALALLAHWIVPCYNAPRKWYLDDWPREIVGSIAKELGAKSDLIDWVVVELGI